MPELAGLIKQLEDGQSPSKRSKAARILQRRADPPSIHALVAAIGHDGIAECIATNSLTHMGYQIVPELVNNLQESSTWVSSKEILRHFGNKSVTALIGALGDSRFQDKAKGILVFDFGATAIPQLVGALPQASLQKHVSLALFELHFLGEPLVVQQLIRSITGQEESKNSLQLFDTIFEYEQSKTVSKTLLLVLSEKTVGDIVGRFLAGLGKKYINNFIWVLSASSNKVICRNALSALEMIGEPAILPLINSLELNQMYPYAIEIFSHIGEIAVVYLLDTLVGDLNATYADSTSVWISHGRRKSGTQARFSEVVRVRTASLLRHYSRPVVVEALIHTMQVDTNTDVKLAALHSLGALNDARAFPPLLSMIEDDNESVKSNAIKLVTTNRTMKNCFNSYNGRNKSAKICYRCLARFKDKRITYADIEPRVFDYPACRICGSIKHLLENVDRVVANLDHSIDHVGFQDAPQGKGFWLYQFGEISNLVEMYMVFKSIPESFYQYHVHGANNEFAEWVEEIYSEKVLADNLRQCRDIIQAAEVMERHVKIIKYEPDQRTLDVNWFWKRQPFDFDQIWITHADDFDVEHFVVQIRNDPDERRQKIYRSIPVFVNPENHISQSKLNLLQDTFGDVS
jgi:hypothetical protein